MKAVIELDEKVVRRLEDLARRQRTTLEDVVARAVSDFAERLPDMPPTAPCGEGRPALPVVHGTRPVSMEELRRPIEEADFEYDMKKLGMNPDGSPYTGTNPR